MNSQTINSQTINLSNRPLSADELALLNKGLSFVPYHNYLPKVNFLGGPGPSHSVDQDKSFFRSKPPRVFKPHTLTFINRSTWTPGNNRLDRDTLDTIQSIIEHTDRALRESVSRTRENIIYFWQPPNLSRAQRDCLDRLRHDDLLVIKPADKGGATVIMDFDAYVQEANRHLTDRKYFLPLPHPIFSQSIPTNTRLVDELFQKGFIYSKQKLY